MFSSLQLKMIDATQRLAQKDANYKKLLNLLCIEYIFVILCGNSLDIESNTGPIPLIAHHTSHVGCVMLMLDGRAERFIAILAISCII